LSTILTSSPWLDFYNRFYELANHIIQASIPDWKEPEKDRKPILRKKKAKKEKRKSVDVKKETLREVIVKIGLERIDTQERIIVEALLDSRAMRLVIISEFV